MNKAIVGLGSNIEPEQNIQEARKILTKQYRVLTESRFEVTQPIGSMDQPDFINGAVLLETALNVEELRIALKQIELDLGRDVQHGKGGPRTIDLDIIVWNDKIIDQDFYNRGFLRKSVLEILPDLSY
jgi:2-amino-4-hydroxy-6-hydroxymethyldihydropteridine diphosphokinase